VVGGLFVWADCPGGAGGDGGGLLGLPIDESGPGPESSRSSRIGTKKECERRKRRGSIRIKVQ
jgi:hypothetical protein